MKKVRAQFSMGLVGCKRTEEFEFDDEATEKDMEDTIREWVFSEVEWGFEEITSE